MPKLCGVKLNNELRQQIRALPMPFGRDQFFELLGERGLLIRNLRRQVRTTMSRHGFGVYPDLVKGAKIMRPGQVWGSDITYWRVAQCFYFVFLVTDSCSSKIIVCHVALGMDGAHVRAALHMAMRKSDHALHGIIHHSDRGSQYCCTRYVNTLKEYGTMVSMTEDSDPRDNAIAYRVNGIL